MIIERVEIANFGPYRGKHEIVFQNKGDGVHLVRGDNGQGKTSIQRAILWCLYGKVYDRKGQQIRLTSLVNAMARDEDIYQFGVKVIFNHEGKTWTMTRKCEARSHSESAYEKGLKEPSLVEDGEVHKQPEHVIRRILPEEVSRFFFFDGEMLRDYEELLDQNSRSMALLRDSIERVLGIPYLRLARDDVGEVQKRLEQERAKLVRRLGGAGYEELVDRLQATTAKIDEHNAQITALQGQMDTLDAEITQKKRALTDMRAVQDLARERLLIESKIERYKGERTQLQADQQKLVGELYKTMLVNSSEAIITRLEQRHAAIMDRYNQKQQLIGQRDGLRKAISATSCNVCGTVLKPDDVHAFSQQLKTVELQIAELTEIPEPNLEFDHHASRLMRARDYRIDPERLRELEGKMQRVDHAIASEDAKLKEVQAKLVGIDADEPRRLELEIERMTKEWGRLNGRKETEKTLLLKAQELKAELDQKLGGIDKKEIAVLAERIDYAKALKNLLDTAVEVYRTERKQYVEKLASEIFLKLRTKESFARLEINQQYGLHIITTGGRVLDRAEWRSSGEEQVVALSLIGALNQCVGLDAPIVMDTPFGRLDTKHGGRILSFLPSLAKEVILMVTDREFRPGDEEYLEGHIRSDYTVTWRGDEIGSEISRTTTGAT